MAQSSAATRIEQESQDLGIDERLWFDEQGNVVRREVDPQASGPRPDDYAVEVASAVTAVRAQELLDVYEEVTALGMTGTDRTIAIEALLEIDEADATAGA